MGKLIDADKITWHEIDEIGGEYAPYLGCSKEQIDNMPTVTPQEPKTDVLDKIRAEIIKYEGDCRLSVDEYPSCKQCTDNVFNTIYGILDKHKAESEVEDGKKDN